MATLLLGCLNIGLLGLGVAILVIPAASDNTGSVALSADAVSTAVAIRATGDVEDVDIGRSMFGPAAVAPQSMTRRAIEESGSSSTAALTLVGVLLAEDEPAAASALILVHHGTPPHTSALHVGGVVDGWRVVAATPKTAKLVAAGGQELDLDVGKAVFPPHAPP